MSISELLMAYLKGEMSLTEFREQFAPLSLDDRGPLCREIIGEISDFDEGFISESQLRSRLARMYGDELIAETHEFIESGNCDDCREYPPVSTSTITRTTWLPPLTA